MGPATTLGMPSQMSVPCRPAADPGSFGIGSERAVNPGNVGILHSEPKQPGFPTPTPTALGSATALGRPQPDGCPMPARGRSPRLWDRLRAGSEPSVGHNPPTALGSAAALGRPQPDGCPMPAHGRSRGIGIDSHLAVNPGDMGCLLYPRRNPVKLVVPFWCW